MIYISYLEEKAIPIESVNKGEIPVVVSVHGNPLQTLANCPEWCAYYKRVRKAEKLRRRAGGLVYTAISSDSEPPDGIGASQYNSPVVRNTKKAKSSRYIDPSSDSESEHHDYPAPGPSKRKVKKHHHISKKRSHSQHVSDLESDDPDAARQARKRAKESREKMGGSHHDPEHHRVKSKRARHYHDGKAIIHIPIH